MRYFERTWPGDQIWAEHQRHLIACGRWMHFLCPESGRYYTIRETPPEAFTQPGYSFREIGKPTWLEAAGPKFHSRITWYDRIGYEWVRRKAEPKPYAGTPRALIPEPAYIEGF